MSRLTFSALFTCILITIFAAPAFAQELNASVEAEAQVDTPLPISPLQPMPRPLDVLKARAQQIQQNTQQKVMDLRAETKMQLQGAPPGEKREVMQGAVDARIDIARERQASSSNLRQNIKDAFKMHGGEIKNRFQLAIRHLKGLLVRIDSRIDKMTAAGTDTSAVAELKVSADTAVAKAETDIKAVADLVASASDTADRAALRAELQAKIKTAHQSIKAAHEAIKKTVRALSDLAKSSKVEVDNSTDASASVQQ